MNKKQLEDLHKDALPERLKILAETAKTDVVPFYIHFYWNHPPTRKGRIDLIYSYLTDPTPEIGDDSDIDRVMRDTLFCERLVRIVRGMLRISYQWHPYPTISERIDGEDYDRTFRKFAKKPANNGGFLT